MNKNIKLNYEIRNILKIAIIVEQHEVLAGCMSSNMKPWIAQFIS